MNAARLGVFSVALSVATASGRLGAADLVVTVSPNPVTVNTSATILAAAFVPGCLDATFDFGDGTKGSGEFVVKAFVVKHTWMSVGKHVVKVVAGPSAKGKTACTGASGGAEVTVLPATRPVSSVPISPALAPAGPAMGVVVPTPTPRPSGNGPGVLKAVPPPAKPIGIEFVPPAPAPNTLLVVKLTGIQGCDSVGVNYGDGKWESAVNPKGSGGPLAFYHSYAKPGTYDVHATGDSIGAIKCFALPATVKVTVQ